MLPGPEDQGRIEAAAVAGEHGRRPIRHTIVTFGRLGVRAQMLGAARSGAHGRHITTIGGLACRLAGGFTREIDGETLRAALETVVPDTDLGSLERIKMLPGFVDAAAGALTKAWRVLYEPAVHAHEHPRIAELARLEAAVVAMLPPGTMRPVDIADAARERIAHAPAVCGPVRVVGVTALPGCWHGFLGALARNVEVTWTAPSGLAPANLPSGVRVEALPAESPEVSVVSAATARHEALEAMRWVRALLARGVDAGDIAIAAVAPADYDDHIGSLAADANLPVHVAHGVPVLASRDGQAAAALADVVVRGLSQASVRRLADAGPDVFAALPQGWRRILPPGRVLRTAEAWRNWVRGVTAEDWPEGDARPDALMAVIDALAGDAATAAALLPAGPRAILEAALAHGPAASVDLTLTTLRRPDGLEPSTSVVFAAAGTLAAAPRPYVRLLGLNSARWPRPVRDDRLLSDHIVPRALIDPLPVATADRHVFEILKATTRHEFVCSHARRGEDGRRLGRSVLLPADVPVTNLPGTRVPVHACSETDRLAARPDDLAATRQGQAADACWRSWSGRTITAHDGAVRADHPAIAAALARTQSASSLRLLLTNPLGFVHRYALGMKAPDVEDEPLSLDALAFGSLVHDLLETAAPDLSHAALAAAQDAVVARWAEHPLPPAVIWQRTLARAADLAATATALAPVPGGARSFAEVPFGDPDAEPAARLPWDPRAPVAIRGTPFHLRGKIDRLDLAAKGSVHVFDYKTGKAPKDPVVLDGGAELQRAMYAFAVRALIGDDVPVRPALVYPRSEVVRELDKPAETLGTLAAALAAAAEAVTARGGTIGPATGGGYDDLAFALPSSATYSARKFEAARARFGAAADIWDAQ